MATYNLTDMKLFVAIADAGNMARGAADCFLAPSSASLRIKLRENPPHLNCLGRILWRGTGGNHQQVGAR